MSIPRHFDSFTSARANLRSVLDAAHEGLITTVVRENERFVVVAADSLRRKPAHLVYQLIHDLGVPEREVVGTTLERATELIVAYWSQPQA